MDYERLREIVILRGGIGIPAELLMDNKLSSNEKLLLSLIRLHGPEHEFNNNDYGVLLGLTERTIHTDMKALQKAGFIQKRQP